MRPLETTKENTRIDQAVSHGEQQEALSTISSMTLLAGNYLVGPTPTWTEGREIDVGERRNK